jgi:diguanylate cyclase (GGDEF)-like protein/PAS domain S-box-containing protein
VKETTTLQEMETLSKSDLILQNLKLIQELEQTKAHQNLYLDVASVLCLALDTEGKIILLNPKGCNILETTKEEAVGQNWFEMFVSDDQSVQAKELFYAIVTEQQEIVEYYENQVHTKNGNKRTIAWHNALLKDANGVITGTFSSGEDITKIQESQYEIERMAHYDTLTNLPNRLLLGGILEHSLTRAKRDQTKLVILYVDINKLKDINEIYGHDIGDTVIAQVSSMLSAIIRREDTLSRIGGDEFVIVLEEIHEAIECERTLQQIMQLFEQPIQTHIGELKLSVSVGIAVYPDDGQHGDILLKNADIALRRAKEEEKSNYCFFAHEMSVQLLERVLMEQELQRAIDNQEFIVYYQPQIDLFTGEILGAEALVRWKHPTLGIIRPDTFIPLAENNRLIIPIGEIVLAISCAAVKRWKEAGLFFGKISVNVSGKQFQLSNVVETITQIISRSSLDFSDVELELTESVLMDDPKSLSQKLSQFKALGIEIAIDDFGTGYSSLSYLKTFPVDKLKIDQSFVRELPNSDSDGTIVKAIIAMSNALGFKTIAEGIEEKQQEDYLKGLGCMQGQGYLYARPLDEEAFEAFLIANSTLHKI